MGKKKKKEKLSKMEEWLLEEDKKERNYKNKLINSFASYVPIEVLSTHVHGIDKEIENECFSEEEKPLLKPLLSSAVLTAEQIQEKCLEIYKNTKEGVEGNTIIHFIKNIQAWDNEIYELGETIVKAKILGEKKEAIIYYGLESKFNVAIFIGSEKNEKKKQAFAVIAEITGDETYLELEEYHQLTISKHSKEQESEIGICTSFSKNSEELHVGLLEGYPNLKCIKHIFNHDCTDIKNDKNPKLAYEKESMEYIGGKSK